MKTACGDSSTSLRQFRAVKLTTFEEKGDWPNDKSENTSSKPATRGIRAISEPIIFDFSSVFFLLLVRLLLLPGT